MSSVTLFAATIIAFAIAMTAHLGMVVGLAKRAPRWRAAVSVLVPPLGAMWSVREHMWLRAALWTFAATGYVVARALQY